MRTHEMAGIEDLVGQGLSIRQMADHFGCGISTVRWRLSRLGLKTQPRRDRTRHLRALRPSKAPPENDLQTALTAGWSGPEIAQRYGVSVSMVRVWLDGYGLRVMRKAPSAVCTLCGGVLDRSQSSWCYSCKRGNDNARYKADPERREKIRLHAKAEAIRKRQWMYEYLSIHPCVDCPESDPVVLQFDHVRGDKKWNISGMQNRSWRTLREEVAKCDVRCANCHARRTAKQLGWYGWLTDQDLAYMKTTGA